MVLPRSARLRWLAVVTVVGCGSDGSASNDGGTGTARDGGDGGVASSVADSGNAGGLPPGAACVIDPAGKMKATSCRDNPLLPTCFQCVDLTDNGQLDGTCVYTCRMDQQDCPQGQTCTAATGTIARTGYQPCRDVTADRELGHCR